MIFLWWVIMVSAISLGGSWYARRYARTDALVGLYVVLSLTAQIAATKIMAITAWGMTAVAPAGIIAFSITYLISDIVNERFGKGEAVRIIYIALCAQVAAFLVFIFALRMPSAEWWTGQAAFASVVGLSLRIAVAGWFSFFVSETIDAYLFAWLKRLTGGRQVWMRSAFSSLPAMVVDSALFVTLAFAGVAPLAPLIVGQIVVKWIVGIIDVPFLYLNRAVLYRRVVVAPEK
jgi:hypothetical protein